MRKLYEKLYEAPAQPYSRMEWCRGSVYHKYEVGVPQVRRNNYKKPAFTGRSFQLPVGFRLAVTLRFDL